MLYDLLVGKGSFTNEVPYKGARKVFDESVTSMLQGVEKVWTWTVVAVSENSEKNSHVVCKCPLLI